MCIFVYHDSYKLSYEDHQSAEDAEDIIYIGYLHLLKVNSSAGNEGHAWTFRFARGSSSLVMVLIVHRKGYLRF